MKIKLMRCLAGDIGVAMKTRVLPWTAAVPVLHTKRLMTSIAKRGRATLCWSISFKEHLMIGPQVLIAEDEGVLRNLIAEALTERGLRVVQAANGLEASQILKENCGVSLLLSDIRMPYMGGYALVGEAVTRNPELKVLMMTGDPGERPPPAVLQAREIATLLKPFDMDRLCDIVVDMLARP